MSLVLSDLDLAVRVAGVVEQPRIQRPDSFVLHAPLELLARAALLSQVGADHRDEARDRLSDLATRYVASGAGVARPASRSFTTVEESASHLVAMIARGELDEVDASAAWLGSHASGEELARFLGDSIAPLLGAAGHGPIFLAHFPRVSPNGEVTGRLLRPLARALALAPEPRLRWVDSIEGVPRVGAGNLFTTLAGIHAGERPADGFIRPIMSLVDTPATAALLGCHVLPAPGVDTDGQAREILRAAAWSMIDEPGEFSPYLWSHCLTMPQAVLALLPSSSRPERLLAVAATHVAGFRSAYATRTLDPDRAIGNGWPSDGPIEPAALLIGGPAAAVRRAWATPRATRDELIGLLIDNAAVHKDAHLVKYTVACLRAAAFDPEQASLYLAAAASLASWWATAGPPQEG